MNTEEFLAEWNDGNDRLLVHTSGSTGTPKPMWVEKQKMLASARITCDFLGLVPGDTALLCMPLDYIAGKMMVVRSIERGLQLTAVKPSNHPLRVKSEDFRVKSEELRVKNEDYPSPVSFSFETNSASQLITHNSKLIIQNSQLITHNSKLTTHNSKLKTPFDLIAMVPSQVYCSLQVPEERELLMQTRHLIIGGGAISSELECQLQSFPNTVWSTYGMTETLSHIALRRLNGAEASEWYTPFSSVGVSLNDDGCLVIDAPLVHDGTLVTNDIAEIAPDGKRFRIIGRKDNVICSGGIKLHIEKIEAKLAAALPLKDDRRTFCISKRSDPKFGEVVVLLTTEHRDDWQQLFERLLPPYERPKSVILTDAIPLTATGKIDRKQSQYFSSKDISL